MRISKKKRVLAALKQQVFNSPDGLSRREVADRLGIDLRTAGAHLEQLSAAGILRREMRRTVSRGRPSQVYCSNAEHLSFLGVAISQDLLITSVLVDYQGCELCRESLQLKDAPSRMNLYNTVQQILWRMRDWKGFSLSGVGLAISRWLQPPLSGSDLYGTFAESLTRSFNVPVYRDVNINVLAYDYSRIYNCRNLAVIHAGNVIEFGLVKDGEPVSEFVKREAWLSHLCVNPHGSKCYCGHFGCLENYVTLAAYREKLARHPSPAEIQAIGEMLGLALWRVARHYPELEYIICGAETLLHESATKYFEARNPRPGMLQLKFAPAFPPVAHGAAMEAAHFELFRYLS